MHLRPVLAHRGNQSPGPSFGVEPLEQRMQLSAALSVDWNTVVSNNAAATQYGLNLWQGMDPAKMEDAGYQAGLRQMAPQFVRYHASEQMNVGHVKGWLNATGDGWDYAKIDRVISATPSDGLAGQRVVTVARWPEAFDINPGNGVHEKLDMTTGIEKYADLVGDLVDHIRIKGYAVNYVEPMNEIDNRSGYNYTAGAQEVAQIFNRLGREVRNRDATMKIVGPAWTNPYDSSDFQTFMDNVDGSVIDVWSYHHYATGSSQDMNYILTRTDSFNYQAGQVRGWLSTRNLLGDRPLWIDEYNMYYTWESDDQQLMRSPFSAVFDALSWKYNVEGGRINGFAAWNDGDQTFGKMSSSWQVRNAGYLSGIANKHFIGSAVKATSNNGGDNGEADIFAVTSGTKKAVMIINRNETEATNADGTFINGAETTDVSFNFNGWAPANSTYTEYLLNADNPNVLTTNTKTWSGTPAGFTMGNWEVRVWIFDEATSTPTAPAAPSGLAAAAASASQINLTWTDNSDNEDGFKIERSTDGTTFTQVATLGASTTGYSDTGLSGGTTYYYRVRAYNGVGDSAYSNTASATTPSANVPAAPTNLTASVTQKNKAKLAWTDNASNEDGFRLWSSRDGITWTLMATVGASAATGKTVQYTSGSLATGTWYFKVTAYNASGESADSNVATLTI